MHPIAQHVPAGREPTHNHDARRYDIVSWHPDVGDIQGLIDGELDARARRTIDAHLEQCPRCMRVAGRLREVAEAVHAAGRVPVPADLEERILAAVAAGGQCDDLTCAECTALASAYIDRELEGAERDGFEAHVFTCESCYATLKQMERAAEMLRETPRRPAPADLYQRITAAIADEQRAASIFTWRRVVAAGVAVAAAAAVLAALLVPRGQAPDSPTPAPSVIAEAPAETHAQPVAEPEAPAASVEPEADEPAPAAAPAARHDSAPVRAPRSSRPRTEIARAPGPDVTPPAPARTPATLPAAPADAESATPAPSPTPTPRPAVAPRPPAPSPSPEPSPTLAPAASGPSIGPAPAPTLAPPETVVAVAPRNTGPATHVAAAAAPDPAPVTIASAGDDPVRIASVVPQQGASRTLYQASSEPPAEAQARANERIERAAERVRGGQAPGWDDPRTGIELR